MKSRSKFAWLAALLFLVRQATAQEAAGSLPSPTPGFQPKVVYSVPLASAWIGAINSINISQIPIASASKDANQIMTGYKSGPTEGGTFLQGKLATQYKFQVSFIAISSSRTQIVVLPTLEARRLTSGLIRGDANWVNVTTENAASVEELRNWMYEQIERNLR